MDGSVLSVAIGFRSYAGDGLGAAEWIAIVSLTVMFLFTFLIYLNFRRDTEARNSAVTKDTFEPIRRLDSLLGDPLLRTVRSAEKEIKRIHHSFVVNQTPLGEDDYDFFVKIHTFAFAFLKELETTDYLMKCKVVSEDFLIFASKDRILPEYNSFFRPLVEIMVTIGERLPADDPKKKRFTESWSGAQELIKAMETAKPRNWLQRVAYRLGFFF